MPAFEPASELRIGFLDAGRPVPGRAWSALAVAVALTLGASLWLEGARLDPTARDQVHDLSLAIRIREGRALSDGNRHPLFPALLAPFAGRDPAFQTRALMVGVVVTVLSLLAAYAAAARIFSRKIGVAAVLGLLIEFRLQGRRICPEPLAAGLLAIGVACLARSRAGPPSRRWTFAGGAALGLAWLTKGSATLALLAAVAWTLTSGTDRLRRLGLLCAGFALAACPLLAWNVTQGHGPLYNVNSAHVMWEDAWDGDLDKRSTATVATWWAGHSIGDGVSRLATGLARQRGIEFVYGAFAVIGLAAWWRRKRGADVAPPGTPDLASGGHRAWASLALWNGVIWLVAFAWYAPIVSSRRLLFPIFPVLVPPVLFAVAEWGKAAGRTPVPSPVRWLAPVRARAFALVLALTVGLVGYAFALVSLAGRPGARMPIERRWLEAADAMQRLCPRGSRVLVRPSRTYPPDWLLEGHVAYVELPARVPDAEVWRWIATHADFVLENDGLLRARPIVGSEELPAEGNSEFRVARIRSASWTGDACRLVRVGDP